MPTGTLPMRVSGLAAVAAACTLVAVHGGDHATARAALPVQPVVTPVALELHPAAPAARPGCAATPRRRDRALAGMVAPVSTVRLARPSAATPPLHGDGYVFPLARHELVVDTFGAARAGVDWHHGDDLFAPSGTHVVAVANGVVFSVGWQRLGGRRLWLRDGAGNEFYYAHLNGYTKLARNGQTVRTGDALGYVGASGDAEQTPPHLHFEIHPASLLGLGYDGAVDPTRYLRAWPLHSAGTHACSAPER